MDYSQQLKYVGKGYLDSKMQPAATLADLPTSKKQLVEGLTIMVMDDGEGKGPRDYWYVDGAWTLKTPNVPQSIDCGEY